MFTTIALTLAILFSTTLGQTVDGLGPEPGSALQRSETGALATVQVDLLPDPATAAQLAADVEAALGPNPPAVSVETVVGDVELPPAYRVTLGPFSSFEEAEGVRARVDGAGFTSFVRAIDEAAGC